MKPRKSRMSCMNVTQFVIVLVVFVSVCSCKKSDEAPLPPNLDVKQEMRDLVQDISAYAKGINSNFVIIPQNGVEIVSTTGDDTGSPDMDYISAIDGIGQEDLFYGYDTDDQATPSAANDWIRFFLDLAKNSGSVRIMVTDYCSTQSKMENSYSENSAHGYLSFAADQRELDNIPTYPAPIYNENADVITNLQSARNFLYLIAPDNQYATKQEFVDAVKDTNYDYIIMDFYYNGEAFSTTQIEELKQKANGGRRLLICYMSIGEAEDYRYYWKSTWTVGNPSFIEKENPNWQGNYVVRYWDQDWQDVIFGNDISYLRNIIDAGFDGVYLDVIDAFEHFE